MRTGILLAALGLLPACGVSAENWSTRSAKATCAFQEKCATANYWAQWVDKNDCLNQTEQALDAEALANAACLFDEDQARACLKALGSSCKKAGENAETLFEPCYHVYNCGSEPIDTATDF